ncbi:MAG: family 14 glycosylhydrolase, partial [Cyanobacteria bacterium SZAS LIN-3]|nr:family 14 glycosylhydrolase [Cyanobacteria bacterium SZAS LIN-3]
DSKAGESAEDFALGAIKGIGTRAIFAAAGHLPTAPLKGVVTGIGSRSLDAVVSRESLSDPSRAVNKLKTETFSAESMLTDAATWTVGEGLFHGGNYLSGGKLGKNPLVRGISMGATFGAVNGTHAEIAREKAAGEEISVGKIVKNGLIEAVIGGAAAGTGMHVSRPRGEGNVVHLDTGPAAGKESGVSLTQVEGKNGPATIGGEKPARMADVMDLSKLRQARGVAGEIPDLIEQWAGEAAEGGASKPGPRSTPPKSAAREFVVDSGKEEFKGFRNRQTDNTFLKVRELIRGADGSEQLGPKKLLFVQKLGTGDAALKAGAEKADLIVTSHPELLSEADRSKHIFGDGEGKVWLAMGGKSGPFRNGNMLRLATGDVQLSEWRKEGFVDPIRLDNGNVSLSVMAPLVVGDPHDPHGESSKAAWGELDRQLGEAKKLGIDAVSTDVWWGLIEPQKGQFDWKYYEKLSDHITRAGLKWVPILSFHRCGGNVGDDVNVPLPEWIWGDVASRASGGDVEAIKYKSEQGHTSSEYVALWADHAVVDNYASVMREFQNHFASRARDIGEVNVSLGPAGELRYPSYNSHDNNTGYPTRGALQSYSDLAIKSFREYVVAKYGGHEGVGKAWGIKDLDDGHILPPDDASGFLGRGDHFNTQYGRDFFDWYNKSLVDHGRRMLSTAVAVFGQKDSPFYGIDLGAKVPGVHWRVGEWQDGSIHLGDRHAELTAGLISTSRGDWDRDADGRGYRPIFSMFKELQPITPGLGSRIVPGFTCLEMPDGDGGPSVRAMPHSLATWAGMEAERQGLWFKGENALNGNLYNNYSWDLMRGFLTLPNQHGYYHGLTFLRMSDIVNNDTARNRVSQLNSARTAYESMRQSLRRFFGKSA